MATRSQPSHANILIQQLQRALVMLQFLLGNQNPVCCITSGHRMVDVMMSRCNLVADIRLDTIAGNYEIAVDPGTVGQLDTGLEVAVHFGDVGVGLDVHTVLLGVIEEDHLEVAAVDHSDGSVVELGNLVRV